MNVRERKSILDSYVTHNDIYAAAISRWQVYTDIAQVHQRWSTYTSSNSSF